MRQLERGLGLLGVVAISVSAMVGSGIFVLPGMAAFYTGPSVWLAYLVAAICTLPAALSQSELASALPESGGTYLYIDRTFGPLAGTVAGMGLWISMMLKSAFALVGFGAYLMILAPGMPLTLTALVLLLLVVILNVLGVRKVSRVQTVVIYITLLKLAILAIPTAMSMRTELFNNPFPKHTGGFLQAVAFVFVSYAGVIKIGAIAGEVKDPGRNIPRGMLLALLIVATIYSLSAALLVGNLPWDSFYTDGHKDYHPMFTLGEVVGGDTLGYFIAGLAILTMTSMSVAGLMAASRFPYAMSRDQLLPSVLGRLNSRFLTPVASIVLTGALMAFCIAFLDVTNIAKSASAIQILVFVIVNLTVIVLRESNTSWYQPEYRSPGYPWIQGFGIISGVVLLWQLGIDAVMVAGATFVSGASIYWSWGRSRAARQGVVARMGKRRDLLDNKGAAAAAPGSSSSRTTSISGRMMSVTEAIQDPFERLKFPVSAEVLVPLFNTERSPEALVEVGASFADGKPMEVLNITEVPEQAGLDETLAERLWVQSMRRRVEAMAEEQTLNFRFNAVITHDAVSVVQRVVQRLETQWVVLEWRGRTREGFTIRNPLGWLINHLPCNLAVFKDAGIRYFRKVLVYPEPGPHDALVIRSADHFARAHKAELTLVRYLPESAAPADVQGQIDYLDQLRQLCRMPVETLMLRGADEVRTLVSASAGFDMLVTGAPPEMSIWSKMVGTSKDALMQRATCSVLRLQTPHGQAHSAMSEPRRARSTQTQTIDHFDLSAFIDPRFASAKVAISKKDALFQHVGQLFEPQLDGVTAREIADGLWAREKLQNTAIGQALAIPHATLPALDRTWLGVITTSQPLDYQTPDTQPVDVIFVTLGPPGDRQAHLKLISTLARLVMKSDLLERLRAADTPEAIVEAILSGSYAAQSPSPSGAIR